MGLFDYFTGMGAAAAAAVTGSQPRTSSGGSYVSSGGGYGGSGGSGPSQVVTQNQQVVQGPPTLFGIDVSPITSFFQNTPVLAQAYGAGQWLGAQEQTWGRTLQSWAGIPEGAGPDYYLQHSGINVENLTRLPVFSQISGPVGSLLGVIPTTLGAGRDFLAGEVYGMFTRPATAAGAYILGLGTVGATSLLGKVGTSARIGAPLVAYPKLATVGRGVGYVLGGLYGIDVGSRILAADNKAFAAGAIAGSEVLPFIAGAKSWDVAVRSYPKVTGYLKENVLPEVKLYRDMWRGGQVGEHYLGPGKTRYTNEPNPFKGAQKLYRDVQAFKRARFEEPIAEAAARRFNIEGRTPDYSDLSLEELLGKAPGKHTQAKPIQGPEEYLVMTRGGLKKTSLEGSGRSLMKKASAFSKAQEAIKPAKDPIKDILGDVGGERKAPAQGQTAVQVQKTRQLTETERALQHISRQVEGENAWARAERIIAERQKLTQKIQAERIGKTIQAGKPKDAMTQAKEATQGIKTEAQKALKALQEGKVETTTTKKAQRGFMESLAEASKNFPDLTEAMNPLLPRRARRIRILEEYVNEPLAIEHPEAKQASRTRTDTILESAIGSLAGSRGAQAQESRQRQVLIPAVLTLPKLAEVQVPKLDTVLTPLQVPVSRTDQILRTDQVLRQDPILRSDQILRQDQVLRQEPILKEEPLTKTEPILTERPLIPEYPLIPPLPPGLGMLLPPLGEGGTGPGGPRQRGKYSFLQVNPIPDIPFLFGIGKRKKSTTGEKKAKKGRK